MLEDMGRMLLIRKVQFNILAEARATKCRDRMLRVLEVDYPEVYATMGEEAARLFVERTMAEAERHKIETEGALIVLLGLRVDNGEDFQLSPDGEWAREMLSHQTVPDVLRLSIIREKLHERNRGRRIEKFAPQSPTASGK